MLNNQRVRIENVLSRPFTAGEHSRAVDRRIRRKAILGADHEILVAVTGRGMHQAGTGFVGDVRRVHQLTSRSRNG